MRTQILPLLLLLGALAGCAPRGYQTERLRKEQQRFDQLIERNRQLLENIRFFEARLDTLEKIHQGQLKALYRMR